MGTLNLGILAHVDAGKTTLTERLLCAAGIIDTIGSVDDGTTQTDTLALERERGITIKSAVASFAMGDLAVNLIDTPGPPTSSPERVLSVLDGAVLVVSAVEVVQAQTPLVMRALQPRVGCRACPHATPLIKEFGAICAILNGAMVVDANTRRQLGLVSRQMPTRACRGAAGAYLTRQCRDDPCA